MLEIYDPQIWRRILVPPDITAQELRWLMTAAFGWAGGHMCMWKVRKVTTIEGKSEPLVTEINPEGFAIPLAAFGYGDANQDPDADFSAFDEDGNSNHGLKDKQTLAELDKQYDFTNNKHLLHWEYDMGDSWEHIIMVEKRMSEAEVRESGALEGGAKKGVKRTSTGKEKEADKADIMLTPKILEGKGHGVAEDAGSYPGWDDLKDAYKAKGTKKDNEEYESRRDWYEDSCGNGDPKGLKGKKRLEHFDVKEANAAWTMYKKAWIR
jgi:hypothetical protein